MNRTMTRRVCNPFSSPASFLFALFVSATTFLALLASGSGVLLRPVDRPARQEEVATDVATTPQTRRNRPDAAIFMASKSLQAEERPDGRAMRREDGTSPAQPLHRTVPRLSAVTQQPRAPPASV